MGSAERRESERQDALSGLREASRLLKRPSTPALEACLPHLEAAIRHLAGIEGELRQGSPAADRRRIRGEVQEISRELRRVNALLGNAGRFHAGLSQLLMAAAQSATYTGDGRLDTGASRRSGLRVEG